MKETKWSTDHFGNKTEGLGFLLISAILSLLSPYAIRGTMLGIVGEYKDDFGFQVPSVQGGGGPQIKIIKHTTKSHPFLKPALNVKSHFQFKILR